MNRGEIKIKQCLLYLSLILLENKDNEQIFEKQMTSILTNPDVVFIPICKTFYEQFPESDVSGMQLIPLFLYSMRLWGDFDHMFRNLWGANGQIAYVQPTLDSDFEIKEPKKAVKVKTVKIASSKKFWNFEEEVNSNLLKGVVYDTATGLQISNKEVFSSHIDNLFMDLFENKPSVNDDSITKVRKMICRLMKETFTKLDDDEKNQLNTFKSEKLNFSLVKHTPNSILNSNNFSETSHRPNFKIFYGPPGTGKTREAQILAGNSKEKYKLVQVHPSSSYEDMIEGIKPVTFANGDVKYEVQDGPIKIMAKKANNSWVRSIASARYFQDGKNEFILINFSIGTMSKWFSVDEKFSCRIFGEDSYKTVLNDHYAKSDTFKSDIKTEEERSFWKKLGFTLIQDSNIEERFVQIEFKGSTWGMGHYVIVLDELNRGNVASILGELVFAISEARGTHNISEKKAITLQYSHEEFTWPQNLSLYGTMNSTDVSLDRIDQAIKRRFDFRTTPPQPELLRIDGLSENGLNVYLARLNDVLLEFGAEYGAYNIKDKLLGHALFLPMKEFIKVNMTNSDFEKLVGNELKNLWDNQISQSLLSVFNGSRDEFEKFSKDKLGKFSPQANPNSDKSGLIFGWSYDLTISPDVQNKISSVANS